MNFDKSPYDSVGVAAMAELFKQAEEIYPICDEPVKPSLFKRLIALVKRETTLRQDAPCGDEVPAHSSF